MRLEKVVIHGFKSFAKKTTFEFNNNFTAIVGPNGSGKSNVSDAIRWVLGEQSVKTLRGKKAEDLIFSGSDKAARLGMAKVELCLDNSDGSFPVDYQEVVISRKLFRSGESEYRVNNSRVRLQDIVMMLAKAKFGQKSYAVIGQGMITHFLTALPEERKQFFDEATGVKEFQIKRDQAINKLIRTEENLVQSDALMTEIEPHLKSLRRQVKRLERREKIEEELRGMQVEYYGTSWNELIDERTDLEKKHAIFDEQIKALDAELEEQQKTNDALATEASRGERYQQLQNEFNSELEQKGLLMKEQAVLKGKLEVEHERQGELSLVWMQRKEDELLKDIHTQEAEERMLKEQMEADEHELQRQEQSLESLKAEFRDEEYEILKLKEQIEKEAHAMSVPEITENLHNIFSAQEAFLRNLLQTKSMDEFRTVQQEGKAVTQQLAGLMDQLSKDERETVEALRVEMKRKEQQLERLVAERDAAQSKINDLKVSVASATTKAQFIHTQLQRMQDDLSNIQSDIDSAEEKKGAEAKKTEAELIAKELAGFDIQIEQLDKKIHAVREELDQFNQEEEDKKSRLVDIQSAMRTMQRKLSNVQQEANTVEVHMARVETKQEDLAAEIGRNVPEEMHDHVYGYTATGQEEPNRAKLQSKIIALQKQIESIGSVDEETMKEYEETNTRFTFLDEQTTDLSKSIEQLESVIDDLDRTIQTQFQSNFKKINDHFQKYFQVLFEGGRCKLELSTEEDRIKEEAKAHEQGEQEGELSGESLHDEKERELIGKKKKRQKIVSGIDIVASPPGKKVSNINALSGGEKSLVSIALLCAIIANNPSPFVVLDEVEAALDEENSEKFAAILKDLSNRTQIIIITHNRVTMRSSDILYGVTMGADGKSHILSVELKEAEQLVKE
ncbi:MAG: AAA family ATPase [Candidatus Kerfeldbacteria bacterium]